MKLCVAFLAVLLVAFLALPTPAGAQLTPSFGVQAGAELAKLSIDDLPSTVDAKFRTGMSVGGRVILPFTPMMSLESGLFYALRGGKFESGSATSTTKMDYLTIPVLARFGFGPGVVQPFLKVGPEVAILLSAKSEPESGPSVDIKDQTSSLDLGLQAAGGVQFPVSPTISAFAQVGYIFGLMDTSDEAEGVVDMTAKNRIITLSVGVDF